MIYFNNAATTYPRPNEVLNAVQNYIAGAPLNDLRGGKMGKNNLDYYRGNISSFFGADKGYHLVFTAGATEALNLAIFGLGLSNESHVITTNTEHNSVLRPLKHLERDQKIELDIVLSNNLGEVNVADIEKKIKKNTRLIVVNHCSNVTGNLIDLEKLSEIVKRKNVLLLVDASQSAGSIAIDLNKLNVDLLAFTSHKSLYGIQGSGGLLIKDSLTLRPLKVGGTGMKSESLFQPIEFPLCC